MGLSSPYSSSRRTDERYIEPNNISRLRRRQISPSPPPHHYRKRELQKAAPSGRKRHNSSAASPPPDPKGSRVFTWRIGGRGGSSRRRLQEGNCAHRRRLHRPRQHLADFQIPWSSQPSHLLFISKSKPSILQYRP